MTEPEFTPSPDWKYSSDYQSATLTNGRFRVRIEHDDPREPEHDGGCPIIRIESGRSNISATMTSYGQSSEYTDGLPESAADILDRFHAVTGDKRGAIDTFERYLRIFHDGNLVRYGPNHSTNSTYVAYITRTLWEGWGNSPKSEVGKADMDEWASYLEGDVWGIIPERLVTWARVDDGVPLLDVTRNTWEEATKDDATWGYYGEGIAKQEAEHVLSYWFSQ